MKYVGLVPVVETFQECVKVAIEKKRDNTRGLLMISVPNDLKETDHWIELQEFETHNGIIPLDASKLCIEHGNKRALQMVIELLNEPLVIDLDGEAIAEFINRKKNVPGASLNEEDEKNESEGDEDNSEYDLSDLDFSNSSCSKCFQAIVYEA